MAYCSGDMREHVEILRQVSRKNENGFLETAWEPLTDEPVAASVSDVSGRDYYAALAAGALDTVSFTTRWIGGVTTKDRVGWDGGEYDILQVNRLGARRDYMTIKTKRRN